MKIAQIAPIIERVPPKKYGGTERVVHVLTEWLVKRGHEVTLFASGDSITRAKLISVYPKSLREARLKESFANINVTFNIGLAYKMQDKFDIIHDHSGYMGLAAANIAKTPSVFTLHGPITAENRKIYQVLNKPRLVTISKAQIQNAPNLNHIGTVYNGLNLQEYPFSKETENYLLFVGRISLEKGVHFAIETALNLNLPLIIAAKLEKVDLPYFNEYIGPFLSDQIRWIGEVTEEERNNLMSKALCFLHPVTWREPFGLTLIEAMACGCPVVAFNKGSIPEIIKDGVTGFVVSSLEEMIDAVAKIKSINRMNCRIHALENFSGEKMTDNYEAVYKKILES